MNNKKVLISVIAASAVGAAFGLLFAPHKGKSTRRRFVNKSETYLTRMEQMLNGYVAMINKKIENIKDEMSEIGLNGKTKVADTIADIVHSKVK